MASVSTNEMKSGTKVLVDGEPYSILENEYRKPGKGQATNSIKIRNLKNGAIIEHRFRSEDKVDKANLEPHNLQFSYRAAAEFHFMNNESFEMVALTADVLGEAVGYLTEGMVIEAMYFEGKIVGFEVPMFV